MRSMANIGDSDAPVLRAAVGRETSVGATCIARVQSEWLEYLKAGEQHLCGCLMSVDFTCISKQDICHQEHIKLLSQSF